MIRLSPGVAQGCFELLSVILAHRLTFPELSASFSTFSGMSQKKVIEAAQELGWIHADDSGYAVVTKSGQAIIGGYAYEQRLRLAILDYVEVVRPAWVQAASHGRARLMAFAGVEIAQVFVEAGLAEGTSDAVVAFWDELAARARGLRDAKMNAVGRQGERLSIAYEYARTGVQPKWVAIESNADGYDVLSVVGKDNGKKLTIEVKASTVGLNGSLFLSRNEWERSLELRNHMFHLWDLSNSDSPALATIAVDQMGRHVPSDAGLGQWATVEVPFEAFVDSFHKAKL